MFQNDQLKSCVLHMIGMQPPCDARAGNVRCSYEVSTGYGLMIFNFLYNSELNIIVEAVVTLGTFFPDRQVWANSAESETQIRSGSSLFAIPSAS